MMDPTRRRRGAVLIAVMVGLAIATAMVTTMVTTVAVERRLLKQQANYQQAVWLCEAGVRRAARALRSDEDYDGEVWQITASELGGSAGARVEIITSEDESVTKAVRVVARFPEPSVHAVQVTRSFTVP